MTIDEAARSRRSRRGPGLVLRSALFIGVEASIGRERRGSYSRSAALSGGRNVPDRGAQTLGGGGRVGVGGDRRARRGRGPRRARRRRRRRAARAGRPGRRRRESGRSSAASARAGGRCARARWRRPRRPSRSGPRVAGEPLGEAVDSAASRSCSGRSGAGRSWTSAAPGLLVRTSAKTPAPAAAAASTQRLERVDAEQRVGGEGVGAEAGNRAPRSRRLADQRLPVGGGGDRDVAALAVGDHQQAGLAGRRAGARPAPPSPGRRGARSRRAGA